MTSTWHARLVGAWLPLLLVLTACGGDDNGDGDTLLGGLSGVVILVIVVWLVARAVRKRGG